MKNLKITIGVIILFWVIWFCGGGITRSQTETSLMQNILLIICFVLIATYWMLYFLKKK